LFPGKTRLQRAWKLLATLQFPQRPAELPRDRAKALIAAIDAGGLPLNAAVVNDLARQLGLDVATTAPVEVTISRIRKMLQR